MVGETTFHPQADRHAALLSPPCSDAQRTGIVLHLQRAYGNSYVQRLLRAMSSQAQRQEAGEQELAMQPVEDQEEELAMAETSEVERQGKGEPTHDRQAAIQGGVIAQDLESRIKRARGGGQPLPESVRASLEPLFGHDFGNVRVHAGAEAHRLSRQLNARAFTTGRDIFFREGAYSPRTNTGKSLLAHELTHVVQQQSAPLIKQDDDLSSGSSAKVPTDESLRRKVDDA